MMRRLSEKHTRLRGEDNAAKQDVLNPEETPPLTRGRQFSPVEWEVAGGNTPAYAGKT